MAYITEVATIFIQRIYSGWITLRNQLVVPIRVMGRRVIELYDALIAGANWEVTPQLSLKRRAGHTSYVTLLSSALYLYSWKSNTQGTITIIDAASDVEYVNSGGTVTSLYTKTTGAGENLQSGVLGIGDFLYVGNPQVNFKWDGPVGAQGRTNWGISISAAASTSGPNTAGAGANAGGASPTWTNPSNVTSAVSYATNAQAGQFTQLLNATQFGFTISAAEVITGIKVEAEVIASTTTTLPSFSASILVGGSTISTTKSANIASTSPQTIIFGSSSDLWGRFPSTYTSSILSDTTFGIQFYGHNLHLTGSACTYSIRNVRITIYGVGGPVATPTGVGTFSAVNGFSYVIAYGNSVSGEVSNASPVSNNTGPFTNKSFVGIPVAASTDTQVNQIRVYRTTDSGGGNQFFEITNSPFANSAATIQDTTLDTNLQVTSQAEINLGNTPPPSGLTNMEWFAGRMWGSTNNLLWASTGPETLSGTAPNSNWNPQFQWVIPGVIVRNVTGPSGMLVFTQDDCLIVRGTDITNYTVNHFVRDFGVRSYNAIDTDGTNLYVFTSDRQFIQVNASGADDIGLPIADQLANVDPNFVYVTVNRYGIDSIVRILDTVNNVYYDFNVNQQCWNLPGILAMAACTAAGSIETSPGVWRLLLNSTTSGTSKLAYRDITNYQDLGTSYTATAVFGSIQLADPGHLAKIGARGGFTLEYTNAGTVPILSVLPNDMGCTMTNAVGSQVTGAFVSLSTGGNPVPDPPTYAAQPKNYRSLRYYWSVARGLSAYVRHLQFQIFAPAENTGTELIGWGIFGDEKLESTSAGQVPEVQGR